MLEAAADAARLAGGQRRAQGFDISAAGQALALQQGLHHLERFFRVVPLAASGFAGLRQGVEFVLLAALLVEQCLLLICQLLLAGPEPEQAFTFPLGFAPTF